MEVPRYASAFCQSLIEQDPLQLLPRIALFGILVPGFNLVRDQSVINFDRLTYRDFIDAVVRQEIVVIVWTVHNSPSSRIASLLPLARVSASLSLHVFSMTMYQGVGSSLDAALRVVDIDFD